MKVDCLKLIFLFLWIMLLSSCTNGELKENLVYQNKYYSIELDYRTGSVVAITKGGENLLDTSIVNQPLFNLRFRNQAEEGKIVEYSALDAKKVVLSKKQNTIQIDFDNFDKGGVKARVTLDVSDSRPDIQWNISMENQTEYMLDHIDFPRLVVKNDLVATGGSGRVFWPAQEGCLVEDLTIRESSSWLKYRPIEYPQVGWGGVYPNSAQMQFMAYYNNKGGLYLASHDAKCNPKGLEFFRTEEGGIMLDLRLFVGGIGKGKYKLPYNVVTSVFDGNWYDAADIYRNWVQSSTMDLPPKIADNKNLPEWYFDSPVIVTYPIRGQRDMGDQTPNKLYPYTNALKYIDNFSKSFDSRIMALLMHWELSLIHI